MDFADDEDEQQEPGRRSWLGRREETGSAKLRTAPTRQSSDDVDWTALLRTRDSLALRIVRSNWFDSVMVVVIMVNMCIVVEEANLRARRGDDLPPWLVGINLTFLAIYCVEICLRVFIERCKYFHSKMNLLDCTIVLMDIICNLLERVIGNQPSFSVLRIIRAGRLVRVLQSTGRCRELWLMLHGLGSAMKAMVWALVLIFVVLLIWSIVAVEIMRPSVQKMDCEECSESFDDVTTAMFTWFDLIFIGEAWPLKAVPIMQRNTLSIFVFFIAFVSTTLGLMNLILMVIVDRATEARIDDQNSKVAKKRKESQMGKLKLRKIVDAMDADHNGYLTLDELHDGWENNEAFRHTLEVMDVSVADLESILSFVEQGNSGRVDSHKFVDALYKMKNEEAQTMLTFIKFHVEDAHDKMEEHLKVLKKAIERQRIRSGKIGEPETNGGGSEAETKEI
mmetsp:Transcript_54678/g.144009  ORF Transcript_54678/g.144009 Transcript_54678/m.144009 type:complete len:451 (-) Transcript_54678:93-1445(-)